MKQLSTTLFGKLTLLLLLLLLIFSTAQILLYAARADTFLDESDQLVYWGAAEKIAGLLERRGGRRDSPELLRHIKRLHAVTPALAVYLIGADGAVLHRLGGAAQPPAQRINPAPLERFAQSGFGSGGPLYAEDPERPGHTVAFSSAALKRSGQTQFVYVPLDSFGGAEELSVWHSSYVSDTLLLGTGASILITTLIGVLIFYSVTRRLRRLTQAAARFAVGDVSSRAALGGRDEIGQLARAFDRVADTLALKIDQMEKTKALRRELTANVAHDLRSPVGSIHLYADTLADKELQISREQRTRMHESIYESVRSLLVLVSDLFELARLDTGEIQPRLRSVDCAALLERLRRRFEPPARDQELALQVAVHPMTPPVNADEDLIERALANLVHNALKHTPPGGELHLSAQAAEGGVQFIVADTGEGIPEEELPRIFDRFHRVRRGLGLQREGTGLGLSIVQKILAAHGARLKAQSTLGKGSSFSFVLAAMREQPNSSG